MLFEKPYKIADGRYFLKVTSDDQSRVLQQINGVHMTIDGSQVTFSVPDTNVFTSIDDTILHQAKTSKVEWFGKEISDETVDSAYQKSLNPEHELAASFATIKGQVVTQCFDTQKNQVALDTLSVDTSVDVLVELVGLVFSKRTFEPMWKVIQVRTKAPPKQRFPREYLFTDEVPEEEESLDL